MADGAGGQFGADADIAGPDRVLARIVEAVGADRSVGPGRRVGEDIGLLAAAAADSRPGGDVVAEVELAAGDAEQLFLVGVGPGLGEVVRGVRRGRDGAGRGHGRARGVDAVILPAEVGREAGAVAAPVEAQADDAELAVLVLDRALAVAAGEVETDAVFGVGAEAAGDVGGDIPLTTAFETDRGARQGIGARPLGRQVEGAADARAAGSRAVEEGGRPVEDLDPLQELRRHELARQDAVEAVVRHVVGVNREAADDVELLEIAEALGDADGGVVLEHVGDAAGLLVAGQLLRIGGDGEGGVELRQGAEQADPGAARDLAALIGAGNTDLGAGDHDLVQPIRLLGQGRGGQHEERRGGEGEDAEHGCEPVNENRSQ